MRTSRLDHLGVRPLVSVLLLLTVSVESVAVHIHLTMKPVQSIFRRFHSTLPVPAAGNSLAVYKPSNSKPGPRGLTAVTVGVGARKGSQ